MSHPMRIGVLHGFRNSTTSGLSFPAMYARVLDQIAFVDRLGFDHVWITEHHFGDDGYMPSPLVMSGAIAARTTTVAIGQDVMLLPFTNPVRLAEDLVERSSIRGAPSWRASAVTPATTASASLGPSSSTTTPRRLRHRAAASRWRKLLRAVQSPSSRCVSMRAGCVSYPLPIA